MSTRLALRAHNYNTSCSVTPIHKCSSKLLENNLHLCKEAGQDFSDTVAEEHRTFHTASATVTNSAIAKALSDESNNSASASWSEEGLGKLVVN